MSTIISIIMRKSGDFISDLDFMEQCKQISIWGAACLQGILDYSNVMIGRRVPAMRQIQNTG